MEVDDSVQYKRAMPSSGAGVKQVVGLDFGTSNIGVAYQVLGDVAKSVVGLECPGESQIKWPMCVVLEKAFPHRMVAMGSECIGVMQARGTDEIGLFRRFKLVLLDDDDASTPEIKADVGDFQVPALTLFKRCLEMIAKLVDDHFRNNFDIVERDVNDVAWLLTVPGIWSDKAKQFMRRAMYEAGLIDRENSRNLHIVLEPEAAALNVLRTVAFKWGKGIKYLVVDSGGGTIDCAGYQILLFSEDSEGLVKLSEQFKSGGGAWGGTYVDDAFIAFLKELFADVPSVLQIIAGRTLAFYELLTIEWEPLKCRFKHDASSTINLQTLVNGLPAEQYTGAIDAYLAKHPEFVGLKRGMGLTRLNLPTKLMMSFFDEPIKRTQEFLEEQLTKVPDFDFVIGVGGFCQSPIMQNAISEVCSRFEKVKARFPLRPSLAVVEGAVRTGVHIFNHSTPPVSERVVRRSYGVETSATFVPNGPYPEEKKRWDGSRFEYMVDKLFKSLILTGDRAGLDARRSCRLVPMYPDQEIVSINFYHTPARDAKYIDEPGVKLLGSVEMHVAKEQDLPPGTLREVVVNLHFGLSELLVFATCKHTGETKREIMKLPPEAELV